MKKICFLIALLLISTTSALAYVETSAMTSENFIKNEGYSPEVYKLIKIKTEPNGKQNLIDEQKKTNIVVRFLKNCYKYLDPYQDSGNFGIDEIHYNNRYNEI